MPECDPSRTALGAAEVIAPEIRINPDLDDIGQAQLLDALARMIDRAHLAYRILNSSSLKEVARI